MSATKQHLVTTAERLFAEEGLDAVSLRRISSEAGQRNTSALQYHFGDKGQLLEAILDYRMSPLNEEREALLAALEAPGVRDLLHALVAPFMGELQRAPDESYYISLLSQLHSRQRVDLLFPDKPRTRSVNRVVQMLRPLLPAMSDEEWVLRQQLMSMAFIHGVASWDYQRRQQGRGFTATEVTDMAAILVNFLAGALSQQGVTLINQPMGTAS